MQTHVRPQPPLIMFTQIAHALAPLALSSVAPARARASRGVAVTPSTPKRSLLRRVEAWFDGLRRREIEAYLAQSTDLHDLELRMRSLERGGSFPAW